MYLHINTRVLWNIFFTHLKRSCSRPLPAKQLAAVRRLWHRCSHRMRWSKNQKHSFIRQLQFNVGWRVFSAWHNCISGHADVVEVLHFFRAHYFGDFNEAAFYEVSIWKRLAMSCDELGDLIAAIGAFSWTIWARKKYCCWPRRIAGICFNFCSRSAPV